MKMIFPLMDGSDSAETESMWVEPVGNDKYVVLNSPFEVFGINHRDVVRGGMLDGVLHFVSVAERSGRSTYRLIRTGTDVAFSRSWDQLAKLGCTYEEGMGRYAVDVPGEADIYLVYETLERGQAEGVWDFEEAAVGHTLG